MHIRPARPEDRERVEDYLIGLSDESRRLRFWGMSVDITDVAARTVDVDYLDHLTLLAFAGGREGTVIGGAQYVREDSAPRAEVSVSIADALQGHGLGSILIAHLAQAARGQRHRDLRGAGAAREPPHDRRVPAHGVRGAHPRGAR